MDQETEQNSHEYEDELDKRLAAFYGPQLREQPLSQDAWHNLRDKLMLQRKPKKQNNWKYLLRRRHSSVVPIYIQQAFERVTFDARLRSNASLLKCTFKPNTVPTVSLSAFKKHLHVLLPPSARTGIDMSILETLLATGLARYMLASRLRYRLGYLFPPGVVLLSGVLLYLLWGKLALFFVTPCMVVVFVLALLIANQLRRELLLASDALAVQWLGRGRICQGLHILVEYERRVRRRKWDEPSLDERIARVCGTQVEIRENDLTLAR